MKLLSLFATLLIKLEVVYGCTWILGDSCYNLVTDPETFFGAQAGCELLFNGYLVSFLISRDLILMIANSNLTHFVCHNLNITG